MTILKNPFAPATAAATADPESGAPPSHTPRQNSSSALLPPPPPRALALARPSSAEPPGGRGKYGSQFSQLARQDSAAPLLPGSGGAEAGQGESGEEREESDAQAEARVRKELPPIRYLRAWTYPVKGIYYLLRHPVLFRPLRQRLPLALLISTVIITLLFVFTYLPQVAFLALFKIHGPLAFLHAALAVLSESATIISFVLETFVIEEQVVDIFDATLLLKSEDALVARGRILLPAAVEENGAHTPGARDAVQRLGEFTKSPFTRFSCWDVCVWLLELPLNFLPLVGPWLFIALQGLSSGPLAHYHYVLLVGLKKKERRVYFRRRRLEYMGFGTVCLLLQTFPILSTLVCFTNAVGAALWAAQVERVKRGEPVDRYIEREAEG